MWGGARASFLGMMVTAKMMMMTMTMMTTVAAAHPITPNTPSSQQLPMRDTVIPFLQRGRWMLREAKGLTQGHS